MAGAVRGYLAAMDLVTLRVNRPGNPSRSVTTKQILAMARASKQAIAAVDHLLQLGYERNRAERAARPYRRWLRIVVTMSDADARRTQGDFDTYVLAGVDAAGRTAILDDSTVGVGATDGDLAEVIAALDAHPSVESYKVQW